MRLGILTALWKRPKLTDLVLRYYADLQIPGVEFVRVAVHSEPELPSGPILARTHPMWRFYYWPNKPLGMKWNVGLAMLRQDEIDAVAILGSDDLVNQGYFERVQAALNNGAEYITLRDVHLFDAPKGRLVRCHSVVPGAGRVISRRVLDALNWKLWDDSLDLYLDGNMQHRLTKVTMRSHHVRDMKGIILLGIKTEVNLWHLEGNEIVSGENRQKFRKVDEMEPAPFLREHFPGVAEELLNWK